MSQRNHHKPDLPACGCAGRVRPGSGDYGLRHLIAALDRMNAQPAVAEVKPGPEDERHRVRQAPDRADFP